jgi:hypothetical protein
MGKRPTAKQLEKAVKDLQQTASLIVRMPEGMRQALSEVAARSGRSMNAEIITALAVHFANEGLSLNDRINKSELYDMRTAIDKLTEEVGRLRRGEK